MRDDLLRIADMREAIERIRSFVSVGRSTFFGDLRVNEAVAYELLKLGEAAGRVSPSFRRAHGAVPWRALANQRNRIVHEYFRLDLDDLWEFVSVELAVLERALRDV
ncbi:MAG TPA: HepT-like ribonuclease domain-containing protein [Thermoplasmata archaeon]|nr:HepT-like ribonuclease domain-containing protein [Thermoplasmata archaeon]